MKRYSEKMWKFLSEAGVLESTDEAILFAKRAYRRQYKTEWQRTIKRCKELRPTFTKNEFSGILERARLYGLHPTSYARDLILSNQSSNISLIPHKDELQNILQAVSMASIAFAKDPTSMEAQALILQAEIMLLRYLKN